MHEAAHLAGQPALTGWVYRLQKQTYFIFGITLGLLVIASCNHPEVLDPAVDFLAALAGGGPALELAVGTGRVAIPPASARRA